MVDIVQAMAANPGKMARRTRRPQHTFNIKTQPFQITPFLIAQVLPGETLKGAAMQAKCVSPPLTDTLLGWWCEQYLFYVKLTDMSDAEKFKAMVVDPDYDAATEGLTSTADVTRDYFASSTTRPGINWVDYCLEAIMPTYFRDDGEAANAGLINSEYAAKLSGNSVLDSLKPTSEYEAAAVDPDIDLDSSGTVTASEVTNAQRLWMSALQAGLTDKTYEDFLRSYGINVEDPEVRQRPELLRYTRDWTYPSRLVDPADGSPVAMAQWAVQERVEKSRFFKEPGFIFGVWVNRPKVYLKNWKGSLTAYLQDGLKWLPGEMLNNVAFGIEAFAAATGPNEAASAQYSLDLRDLLLYGEQFVNHDLSTANGTVSLPSADGTNTKYATDADVQALFSGTVYDFDAEGIINLSIASHLLGDLTPNA